MSGLLYLLLVSVSQPMPVAAHPLDEFYQAVYVSLAPNRITLQVELYTGVLIAPRSFGLAGRLIAGRGGWAGYRWVK